MRNLEIALEGLLQDLRYATRRLSRSPGFTAIVILTLALGVGANSAIFSVVNGVLLKPLDYRSPQELVSIYSRFPALGFDEYWLSAPEYVDLQEHTRSFSSIGAWSVGTSSLTGIEVPLRVTTALATAELFPTLGVAPHLGHVYSDAQDVQGAPPVVVLSYGLWQTAFGADPAIVGERIEVDGVPATVVGVMPAGFDIEGAGVDLWAPAALPEHPATVHWSARGNHFFRVIGRLAPDATLEQAQAELAALIARWHELTGGEHAPNPSGHPIVATRLHENVVADVRPALLILLGAVGFVLLIACANVANLLLARAEARQREISVRIALGAGRRRLIRQFLTESVLLAAVGGAVGLLLGDWGVHALLAVAPDSIPRAAEVGLDPTVLLFTAGVSLLTGVLFGLAPLLHLAPRGMELALKDGGRSSTSAAGRRRLRQLLVGSEIALAVMLVIGAGLLLRSFAALQRVDAGFEAEGLLTFETVLPASYQEAADVDAFYGRLIDGVEALPGVTSAAAMSGLPPVRDVWGSGFAFEGKPQRDDGPRHNVDYYQVVSGDYFGTMRIPILAGRAFTEGDGAADDPVVVISQALAEAFYPDENPIGRRLRPIWVDEWFTIVGIARDVRQGGLSEDAGTEIYFHTPQMGLLFPVLMMNVVVRSERPPSALADELRSAVRSVDPSVPVAQFQTMQAVLAGSVTRPRFIALLLAIFAGLALALAAIGIYGVLSYSVAARNREIGIRMAIGADASGVMGMVLRDGLMVAAVGLAAGIAGALALTRVLSSMLFGISASDPATFVVAPAVLALVALAACYIPARRATRVNPVVALRAD